MMSSSIPSTLPFLTLAFLLVMLPVQPARGGSGGVDEAMGEATYSIPIVTPPGTAGTGPSLSLEYRSGIGKGGAGYVGFGWRIAGLSAIDRDLKHGVPYDYDTLAACGTALCYRDEFTLDGQDLFCADSSCSGGVYKTQQDDGSLITYLSESQGWEIQDRDGTTFIYGPSLDTQIENPNNQQVFSWLLSRVEDVHGNWIEYVYDQTLSAGIAYPIRIDYAQQGASANRAVVFTPASRSDHPISYRAGFRQELDQNIIRIESRASGQTVAAYELGYTPSPESQRSLLTSVQRIGSDDASPSAPYAAGQQPYVFSYSSSQGFQVTPTNLCNGACPNSGLEPALDFSGNGLFDVNRDGLPDSYQADSSGTTVGLHNGLGIPKTYPIAPEGLGALWHPSEAKPLDGFQFEPIEVWSQVLDVDGDGYPDWVKPVNGLYDADAGFDVLLGSDTGFATQGKALATPHGYWINNMAHWDIQNFGVLQSRARYDTGLSSHDELLYRTLLDMTGDGIPDYVVGAPAQATLFPAEPATGWLVFPGSGLSADGTTVEWSSSYIDWPNPAGQPIEMVHHDLIVWANTETLTRDLNGDGLPDLIHRTATATTSEVRVAYNNGAGFEALELTFSFPSELFHPRVVAGGCSYQDLIDLNGDGFLDQVVASDGNIATQYFFMGAAEAGWNVYYGTGSGFRATHESWAGSGELGGAALLRADLRCVVGLPPAWGAGLKDLNGDGLLDRYSRLLFEVYLNEGVFPDLMTEAITPGDASIDFDYRGSGSLPDTVSGDCTTSTCDTTQICGSGSPGFCDPVSDTCIVGTVPGANCNWDYDCEYCGGDLNSHQCVYDSECGVCTSGHAQGSWCEGDSQCTACLGESTPLHPELPLHRPVVVEMGVWDGRSGPAIVSRYQYAGGVFDNDEKEFRGFGSVTRTDVEAGGPVDGTDVVSTYRTDRECAGRLLDREVWYDTTLYQREALTYGSNSEPEGWSYCLLESQTQTAFEGAPAGAERSRYSEWVYGPDPVATHYNVLEQHDLGEVDGLGTNLSTDDDAHTYFSYATPVGSVPTLVSRVSQMDVQDGSGSLLSRTLLLYDWRPLGLVTAGLLMEVVEQLDDPWATPPIQNVAVQTVTLYDANGNVTRRQGPTGFKVDWTYDSVYETFPETRIEGAGTATPLTTSFSYAGCPVGLAPPPGLGLPCQIVDPRNQIETYGYDVLGRVVEITRRNDLVETVGYLLPDRTDPGSPAGETRVTTTRVLLDGTELLSTILSDGLGRVFQTFTPGKSDETIEVVRSFDDRGRLATETLPHFDSELSPPLRTFYYDPLGRPAAVIDFDGATQTVWTYEPWKVTEDAADPDPDSTPTRAERLFDGHGRLVEVAHYEDANLGTGRLGITAQYDPLGRMTQVDNQGVFTSLYYDTLGRRVRIDDPDSGRWEFRYDHAGLLLERRQNVGGSAERTQSFTYDALQRLETRGFTPAGNGSEPATFVYGTNPAALDYGRLAEVQSTGTSYTYEYDAAGRVNWERQHTQGSVFINQYAHDELDRVKTRTFPDGEVYTYVYDALRLDRIEGTQFLPAGSEFDILMGAEYDALGRTIELQLGDTIQGGGAPAATLLRTYDPSTARLQRMEAIGRAAGSELDLSLSFDGLGRLIAMDGSYAASPLGSRDFHYDGLGRLKDATGPWEQPEGNSGSVTWDYQYDALGNLTQQNSTGGSYTRTWTYADPARPRFLTQFSENLTGQVDAMVPESGGGNPASINGQAIVWNAQNRLHRGVLQQNKYAYDAFDRRTAHNITGRTVILYIGNDFEYDRVLSNATKFFFVNGERVATRATGYRASTAGQLHPAYRWVIRPLLFLLVPIGAGLALLGLFGLVGAGLRLEPPRWVVLPGIGLLILCLVLLPWAKASAGGCRGCRPNDPTWYGGHGAPLLVYAADHLGSTRVVIDATGEAVETRDYAPFGRTISHTGDFQLKHQFTGQPYDSTNELQYHGARMYNTRWGRFLSPDEHVEGFDSQGLNPYAYVRNQPTSRVDRNGSQSGPVAAPPGPMRGARAPIKFLQDALDKMGQSAIADQIVEDTKALIRNGKPPAPGTKAFIQISVITQDQPQKPATVVIGAVVQRLDVIEGQEPTVIPLLRRSQRSTAVKHIFLELNVPTVSPAELPSILGFPPLPEIPLGLGVNPPPKTKPPPRRSLEIHVEEQHDQSSTGATGSSLNGLSGLTFYFSF